MDLDDSPSLNQGRLLLYDFEQGQIGRWVATSGLGMYQGVGDWSKQRGGVCPAAYQCNPTFANHWVQVAPIDLSSTKGVEGDAYPMTPFAVRTKEGIQRSDLLIHRDANTPGSLGCIVLPGDEFKDFQTVFNRELIGHEKVKLWIQYNF